MNSWFAVWILMVGFFVKAECSPRIKIEATPEQENGTQVSPVDPVSVHLFYEEGVYNIYNFGMGTPGQAFKAIVLTNSSYTLVYPSGCSGCPPENPMGYNHDVSDSFVDVGNGTPVAFGDDDISGTLSSDLLHLNGLSVNQWFIERNGRAPGNPDTPLIWLGMGYADDLNFGATPYLVNLAQTGLNSSFCLSLNGKKAPSWFDLGGPNSSHYKGSFSYIQVTSPSNWGFKVDSVLAAGYADDTIHTNVDAWIDITTDYMYGPMEDIGQVYQWIGATEGPDGQAEVPCEKVGNLPKLYFILGENVKVFAPSEYIKRETTVEVGPGGEGFEYGERCTSMFLGMDGNSWRLGTTFIKDDYVLFDAANNRIGYAASYF